ncbi:MAG TPA: efflux transporter outer membrane subunit [Steroidobacteraceae bacterium]|nr:efflux transporter outer membrane subunit [Steroidobacteraceae bacterium]
MTPFRSFLLALTVTVLASCAVGPNYHTPDEHPPADFVAVHGQSSMTSKPTSQAPQAPDVDFATWWRSLNDPELDSLVSRAVAANPDAQIALDRLQAARTYERSVIGTALPTVGATAAAGRGTGSDLIRSRASNTLYSADNSSGLRQINEVGGFDAAWQLDVFGKYRREIEAARADAQASLAERNQVLIAVIANVARAYIDMRGLQTRASILHNADTILQESLRIVRIRYERGITNELDLTLATRELGVLEAQIAPVEAQVSAAQYTIATLLGLYPEDLIKELTPPAMIPSVPAVVQSGLPLDLLRRRPDISQAERELAAYTARIGVATANLFPQLSISGAIGFQRQALGNPVIGRHIWSAGPSASWSLLDFGALDAQVEIARLRTREQLVNYKRTIQNAVKEVDTTWDAYGAEQERVSKLGDALIASQRAVTLANERYTRGLTDFLNVVDAERQAYDIEEQYSDAQVSVDEQFIALYRSLGGGWEKYQELPPVHIPQPAIVAAFHRVFARGDDVLKDQGTRSP